MNARGNRRGRLARVKELVKNQVGLVVCLSMPMLLLPLALFSQSRPRQTGQAKAERSLCYAFLRGGDLWTVCQGKRERIDIHGRALDFAVSSDGSYFAVQENLELSGIGRTRQVVVSLTPTPKEEKSRQVDYPELLSATCGTIVSFEFVSRRPFDLIKSRPMEAPPYKYFRCSADRRVTVGITEEDEEKWYNRPRTSPTYWTDGFRLKVSRSGKQSEFLVENRDVFDVSPNGKYLVSVFSRGAKQAPLDGLCVAGPNNESSCVSHYAGAVSVSDNGGVLLWAGEEGVKYWRPGLKTPRLLEKGTEKQPQWITPEVAAALHQWNTSRSAKRSSP